MKALILKQLKVTHSQFQQALYSEFPIDEGTD